MSKEHRAQVAWEVAYANKNPDCLGYGYDFSADALAAMYESHPSRGFAAQAIGYRACPEQMIRDVMERLGPLECTSVLLNSACPVWALDEVLGVLPSNAVIPFPASQLSERHWETLLAKGVAFDREGGERAAEAAAVGAAVTGGCVDAVNGPVRRWLAHRDVVDLEKLTKRELAIVSWRRDLSRAELELVEHKMLRGQLFSLPAYLWVRVGEPSEVATVTMLARSVRLGLRAFHRFGIDTQARLAASRQLSFNVLSELWYETRLATRHRHVIVNHPRCGSRYNNLEAMQHMSTPDLAMPVASLLERLGAPVEIAELDDRQLGTFTALAPTWESTLGDLLLVAAG